jgi:putative ABC transport system ATP-binding protein
MIELHGVSKSVPSGTGTLTILHPIDLVVPAKEVVAITGASGSGKSTLLGLIAGLDAPTTGRIVVDGIDITALGEDALAKLRGRRIGFVFQFFHLLPSLTALENILVPMEIAGLPGARTRALSLLDEVGLSERGHHYPSQLSGGEQQRVAIARALANDPPLLLADEPTGNLDSTTGHQIIDLLLNVHRSRGTTLVLVTHDPELASVAHMSIALRDGRVVPRTPASGIDPAFVDAPDPALRQAQGVPSESRDASRTADPGRLPDPRFSS